MAGGNRTGENRIRRAALYQAVAMALLVGSSVPAFAQAARSAESAAALQQAPVDVAIPAQPLGAALEQFALQTGIQVVYAGNDLVRDLARRRSMAS